MGRSVRHTLVVGALVAGLGAFAVPSTAAAGPCDPVTKYTVDVWGQLNSIADQACKEGGGCANTQAKLQKLYAQADKVVKWWNSMMKGTWAQLGPRNYDYGKVNKGTLVAPGDRTWIPTLPADKDSVDVTVATGDGKAKATVYVCVAEQGGKAECKEQFDIDGGKTVKKTVTGVAGKLVTVRLDGKGVAGQKLEYQLTVK